ncbi:MAG: SH3 domain-containing protein [Clostridia bacterium]|nr:SH3 domain-containing protein [Clostridia bacterium]
MKTRLKKLLSMILITIIVSTVIVPFNVSADTQKGIVKVDSYLNVRSEASTDSSTLGKLYNNETVTVVDTVESGGIKWYKIQYAGTNGYVSSEYITLISSDTSFEQYLTLQGFPESYKDGLRALHAEYPEWVFVAQHITPDWNTVIKNESKVGYNLVPASSPAEQKSFEKDAFNWDKNTWYGLDGQWVAASEQIVCWAMDPRNFLDKKYIFQFEKLNYVSDHTLAGINNIIKGTFMADGYPDDEFDSFAEAIMAAATEANVSAYHLASRLKQEQGSKGNPLAHGTVSGYKGYYNYFNIKAYDTDSAGMYVNGAAYAKKKGWNTPYKALVGGANFIASGYISKEQDTLYLQKFDVTDGGNGYYTHQYMTNVFAPSNEAARMMTSYTDEVMNSALVFYIPVYRNMPETACTKPTRNLNNNNLLDSLSVSGYTITPTFYRYTYDYSLVIQSNTVTSVTINAKTSNTTAATVSGTGKFNLKSGENTATLVVTAPSGVKRTYTISITLKTSAQLPTITTDYSFGEKISGITPLTSVSDFKKNITIKNGSFKIVNSSAKEITSGNIGTGHLLKVYNETGIETGSHEIVIYGDNNGDGDISILDLLRIQKHLLGTQVLKGPQLESCDATRDGSVDIFDLLREQKYLLGTGEIKQ